MKKFLVFREKFEKSENIYTKAEFWKAKKAVKTSYENGSGWIRTIEGVCRQIYSLIPLSTRAHSQNRDG